MKQRLTLIVLLMALIGGAIVANAQPDRWKVNDRVLVHWSGDEYWYPAAITEVSGGRYHVAFDDGDKEWTTNDRITVENLGVGDRVFANWQGRGLYYPGEITARRGDSIDIAYDDGDRETTSIAVVRVERKVRLKT